MSCLCCVMPCNTSTKTPVISIEERDPVKCDSEKTADRPPKTRTGGEPIGLLKYRPQDWVEPTYLPGQLMDDDLIDKPRGICDLTGPPSVKECEGSGEERDKKPRSTTVKDIYTRNPKRILEPLSPASRPADEIFQNLRPNLTREAEGIPTAVRGSAPKPSHWKQLYVSVMKPREQILSVYTSNAAKRGNLNLDGVLNVSPASEDLAELVQVMQPMQLREYRLQALRARLTEKLRKPRLKKKDSRRRPTREAKEWDIATVISDSEEGDEAEEILYSTYNKIDKDLEYLASDENDGKESERESKASPLWQGEHSWNREANECQSRALYTPDPRAAARRTVYTPDPRTAARRTVYTPDPRAAARRTVYTPEPHAAAQRTMYTPEPHASARKTVYTPDPRAAAQRMVYTPEPHTAAQSSSTPTRKLSRASFRSGSARSIQKKTSSDDVEEVFVLPEEVVQPARPRRRNVLRNALFKIRKGSSRVHPSVALEQPSTSGASAERSSSGDSSEDRTATSTPASEYQAMARPGVNFTPSSSESSVAAEDPPQPAVSQPRFRWSPDQLFARRFNAFEKSSKNF